MNLLDLIQRPPAPEPWSEGEKIPWNDPAFSARMLKEHLSQAHDAASRRADIIDRQVGWIHEHVLKGQPAHILDLGCGPGLYASRFAALGHTCTGIDFSPASVEYARQEAAEQHLNCTFIHEDVRRADYGSGYDLAMLIFGEFNVFTPDDARLILRKAHAALNPGGALLLEPHTDEMIYEIGHQPDTWYTASSGLFSDKPHLSLHEHLWNGVQRVTIQRYFIIDATSGAATRWASSMQAYTQDEYRALLTECGFGDIEFYASLNGDDDVQPGLLAILAYRL